MIRDAKVSVIDGQSLRMSRIRSFLDPVLLTYKSGPLAKPQKLSFSLEHALDAGPDLVLGIPDLVDQVGYKGGGPRPHPFLKNFIKHSFLLASWKKHAFCLI